MHISSINYQKTFNIGSYQSIKLGAEMSLDVGEDAETGMETLRTFVHEYFTKTAPTEDYRGTQVRDIVEDKLIDTVQATLYEIDKCQTIDELKGWWLVSKGNLTLSGAYKSKEKQLNDAK